MPRAHESRASWRGDEYVVGMFALAYIIYYTPLGHFIQYLLETLSKLYPGDLFYPHN